MSPRPNRRDPISRRLASFFAVLAIATGCYTQESRVAYHNERGAEFLAKGNTAAAQIEYSAALSFDPKDFDANLALADMAETSGHKADARFYLREILSASPDNSEVAVRLATLIRDDEPFEARALLLKTIKHDEGDATAHLGMSQLEFWSQRYEEALDYANAAVQIDPELPGAHWQRGIVYQGMLMRSLTNGEPIDEDTRQAAVDAFGQFIAVGGEPEWKARLEQAEILAAGSHNATRALAAARRALEVARTEPGDGPKLEAAAHLARIGRQHRNRAAYADALEVVLEVHPRDFRSWRNLAELRAAAGEDAEAVYRRLLETFPDDPEAHILYSKHLGTSKGVWAALRYFEEQIEAGVEPARMLSALRSYQVAYRLWKHAGRTLERMQRDHPADPWTRLEEAKKAAEEGRSLAAIAALEEVVTQQEIVEAYDVLAKLERFHDRPYQAVEAIERAAELQNYYDPLLYKTLSELRYETGNFAGYIEAVDKIAQHDELTGPQRLDRARALYVVGDRDAGREALIGLAGDEEVGAEATIEFIRAEGSDPDRAGLARRLLLAALAREPDAPDLITARVELSLRMNRSAEALEILDGLDIASFPPNVRYLRSRLRAEAGNFDGAVTDIGLAIRGDATIPDATDFALLLYARHGDPARHLAKIEAWIEAMRSSPLVAWLDNSRRIAMLHLLRSRLLHVGGKDDEAIAVLEEAVANYEYTGEAHIDLAYLLATTGRSAKRAIEIANAVVAKQRDHPRALDALGFAYLVADEPVDALRNIRLAIRSHGRPNALFHYHESLALRELGREPEAIRAIDKVLRMEPRYPNAAELKRELEAEVAQG